MARALILSGGLSSFGPSLTRYICLGTGDVPNNGATEADAQITFRTAGTFYGLGGRVVSNDVPATSTVTLRKGAADATQTFSVGASSSGQFSDATHTDAVAAADKWNYKLVTGAGGTAFWLTGISVIFNANDSTVQKLTSLLAAGVGTSVADTRYTSVCGVLSLTTTEANVSFDSPCTGIWKNMNISISANARTAATTFGSRRATGAGNQVISVASAATGVFEDTSNTDTVTTGDKIDYYRTIPSGTGTITITAWSSEFLTTDGSFILADCQASINSQGFGTTNYFHVAGTMNYFSETWVNDLTRLEMLCSQLYALIPTNTINSGSSTLKMRKNNAANASLAVSIGFGATGMFKDTTNSCIYFNTTNNIDYECVASGTAGTLSFSAFVCRATPYEIKDGIGMGSVVPTLR